MPILVKPPPAPPAPTVPPPVPARVSLASKTDSLDLTRSTGVTWLLGATGLDMPPPVVTVTEPLGWDGGRVDQARYGPRNIWLPLEFHTASQTQLHQLLRRVARIVNPRAGDTTVTVAHPDGRRRTILGRYSGGLDGELPRGGGLWRHRTALEFTCPDPYWSGSPRAVLFAGTGDPLPFLGEDFLPLRLNASSQLGEISVTVDGDAESFPRWTIHGPGDFTATDTMSGASWTITGLTDSDIVVLDARRGIQTVTINGDTNGWSLLEPGSVLWPLPPGDTTLDLAIEGLGPSSAILLEYTPRWLTAW